MLGGLVGEEGEGVGQDVEDRLEALDGARRRARGVQHDRPANRAGQAPGQAALGVHQPHGLGQARRLSVDDGARALRGQVPGPKARPAGGHDEPGEIPGELTQGMGHAVDAVGDDAPVDDREAGAGQAFGQGRTRAVFASPGDDAVGDGEDLGLR